MFEFHLTLDEANLVLAALGKQPFEVVAGLINNIKTQADPQIPRVQEELARAKAEQDAAEEQKIDDEVVKMTTSKGKRGKTVTAPESTTP